MRVHVLMLLLCLCNSQWKPLSARKLPLRPREIHKLFSPEARTVSSGLAALAGLTVGLKKVLTGIFIYDVITANVTDLEETQTAGTRAGTAQEICFSASNRRRERSVDYDANQYDDDDNDNDNDAYDDYVTAEAAAEPEMEADRQVGSGTPTAAARRAGTVTCIVLLKNR